MTTFKFTRLFAWLLLAFIIFVTISPIGLRPHTITTVDLDRAAAYMLAGLVFALAYPKQWKLVAILLLVGAFAIEFLQYLSPSRHARVHDADVKAIGAAVGLVAGWLINKMRQGKPEARASAPITEP
jgi:VanZ family protein